MSGPSAFCGNAAAPFENGQPPQANILRLLHNAGVLRALLADKTTGSRIIWATDTYNELGIRKTDPMKPEVLLGHAANLLLKTFEGSPNEIRRLMNVIICSVPLAAKVCFYWSYWRLRHQFESRKYHYKINRYNKLQLCIKPRFRKNRYWHDANRILLLPQW